MWMCATNVYSMLDSVFVPVNSEMRKVSWE